MIEWVHTECVGLINLFVDSLDHIYGKSYLNSMSDIVYKSIKFQFIQKNNSWGSKGFLGARARAVYTRYN